MVIGILVSIVIGVCLWWAIKSRLYQLNLCRFQVIAMIIAILCILIKAGGFFRHLPTYPLKRQNPLDSNRPIIKHALETEYQSELLINLFSDNY